MGIGRTFRKGEHYKDQRTPVNPGTVKIGESLCTVCLPPRDG